MVNLFYNILWGLKMTAGKYHRPIGMVLRKDDRGDGYPWLLKLVHRAGSHEGHYQTKAMALQVAKTMKWYTPTWNEVTCGGKYGTD